MKKNIKSNKIIGYTAGVFDLFHIGHLNILRNSKAMCDKLIVGITTDELSLSAKNKIPIIPYNERADIVRSIKYVDLVVPQENLDKLEQFKKLKFDIMFVGDDWYQNQRWKETENLFKKLGVKIIYFPYTKTTSSTLIRNIIEKKINNENKI
jgi:glycerol-3-phosphate cytidylyltransferase